MPLGTEMARGKKRRKNKVRKGKKRRMREKKRLSSVFKLVTLGYFKEENSQFPKCTSYFTSDTICIFFNESVKMNQFQ